MNLPAGYVDRSVEICPSCGQPSEAEHGKLCIECRDADREYLAEQQMEDQREHEAADKEDDNS